LLVVSVRIFAPVDRQHAGSGTLSDDQPVHVTTIHSRAYYILQPPKFLLSFFLMLSPRICAFSPLSRQGSIVAHYSITYGTINFFYGVTPVDRSKSIGSFTKELGSAVARWREPCSECTRDAIFQNPFPRPSAYAVGSNHSYAHILSLTCFVFYVSVASTTDPATSIIDRG
jgi:hypothetical protein